jgi:hypothetical protein
MRYKNKSDLTRWVGYCGKGFEREVVDRVIIFVKSN